MSQLIGGLLALVAWGVLQFVVQPTTGLIHLLLAGGVILIIRGIVAAEKEPPPST